MHPKQDAHPFLEGLTSRSRLSESDKEAILALATLAAEVGTNDDEEGAVVATKLALLEITRTIEHHLATTGERNRLLALFEQAPGFMALRTGPSHQIEFTNIAYRELIGGRDVTGRPTAEAMPELERAGLLGLLDEVYRTGIPYVEEGRRVMLQRDPAGPPQERVLNFVYQPVRDDDRITGVLLQGQDVTDQVRAQERAQLLQNNLIHLSRVNAMATMASVLAHELNQPITAAVNFLRGARRILEGGGETALACCGIEGAEESVMRAGDIIRRIRTMVATGEVLTERHDVAELVGGALQLALLGARDAGVTVEANLPPGLAVMADRTQIEQVVLNIVRNAIEAMASAPRRRLSIAAEAAGETIEIRIGDSGPGLSAKVQEHLFDPFFTSKAEGMGIGLSISRTIVEAHDGLLWAENGPDGGALFCFTLPAAPRSSAPAAGDPAPPLGPGSSALVGQRPES